MLEYIEQAIKQHDHDDLEEYLKVYSPHERHHLFHAAVESSNTSAIKVLKQYGWNPNGFKSCYLHTYGTDYEMSALMLAIEKKDEDCVNAFIECEADLELGVRDETFPTPLQYALFKGDITIAVLLVKNKVNLLSFMDKINPMSDQTIIDELLEGGNTNCYLADLINNNILNTQENFLTGNELLSENTSRRKKIKRTIGKLYTNSNNIEQQGRSSYKGEDVRPYHSYKEARERQLLRHIASQLFFALQHHKTTGLVEIQALHLVCDSRHNLFIAANKVEVTTNFNKIINENNFEALLKQPYLPNDDEGKARSKRYSKKLNNRIFGSRINIVGDNKNDTDNATNVGNVLRSKDIKFLKLECNGEILSEKDKKLLDKISKFKENKIFFIVPINLPNQLGSRHAEEFLCDIVSYIKETTNFKIYTAIAGKKRPCMGCYGRMDATEISNFNKYPGRLWLHTIENQSDSVYTKSVNTLSVNKSYVSQSKALLTITDYDSGSDSDEEANLMSRPV